MIGPLQIEMKEFKRNQKFQVQTDDAINGQPRYSMHIVDASEEVNLM